MVLIPTVKWAQRASVVYLTIDVQDSKGECGQAVAATCPEEKQPL
jgi:hypothetical protein